MDARDVASHAKVEFEKKTDDFGPPHIHKALISFFQGVGNGSITMGQSWVADIMLGRYAEKQIEYTEQEMALFCKIFSSGLCAHGQSLSNRVTRGGLSR